MAMISSPCLVLMVTACNCDSKSSSGLCCMVFLMHMAVPPKSMILVYIVYPGIFMFAGVVLFLVLYVISLSRMISGEYLEYICLSCADLFDQE